MKYLENYLLFNYFNIFTYKVKKKDMFWEIFHILTKLYIKIMYNTKYLANSVFNFTLTFLLYVTH